MSGELRFIPLLGMPEVRPGDDLARLVLEAAPRQSTPLLSGDILIVTQKVVSKAEGRLVPLGEVEPSPFALSIARDTGKDARLVEMILRESRRVVKMDRGVLITETHHGYICANAGVDQSNTGAAGVVSLLPRDPDASAAALRQALEGQTGLKLGVVISDSFGRPWREGSVNVAIGVAGLEPVKDYTGQQDPYGYTLRGSTIAVADELASAAELVMGKTDRVPAVIARGYPWEEAPGSARSLLRPPERDLFR